MLNNLKLGQNIGVAMRGNYARASFKCFKGTVLSKILY